MSTVQEKVVVLRQQKRDTVPADVAERDFWMSWRHTLLQQLAVVEKRLGISRRCRHCGEDLSTK